MAETLRIEIPIETVDETLEGIESAISNLNKMSKAFKRTQEETKKANEYVTQFDKQSQKTEKSLARWTKEKYEILIRAKDAVAPVIGTIRNGLRGIAGRTWNVTMRVFDYATAPIRGVINLLKNPVFQVGAVLGISVGLKDTIDTYKDFEAAMSQVQAVSGASGSELSRLTDKAKEMGATTKFTAQESAEAFNYMAMAGWKTEDMLGGIEGILSLAAASGEDLATTSDIVTDALTAFGMKAGDAGHFSDVLAVAASNANTTVSGMGETFKYAGSMAGSLKYSIEDVALMTGLMANSGIKGTMAGTALNSIFTRLSTNTNGAADAMSDLGIAFFTSEGNARDLSDVMEELRNATADMTDEQKSQLANTIAGTEAQKGLIAILNASKEDYDKLSEAISNVDGAAAAMSDTMMDNLQGSITLLQSAVDGVKISFGERLAPYVRDFVEWLMDQMPAIDDGLNKFMDRVETGIDRIKRKFKTISGTREWQDADFFGKVRIAWDEFIADPFFEWWNSVGKAKFAGFAQDIGLGIGTGLKASIMTLLGIDIGETIDEGVSIGASFAKGFSEGFDFDAVSGKLWQGFKNMFSSAGKLFPGGASADLSSVLSAVMLGKMAMPLMNAGKGVGSVGKWLFGANTATGISRMGTLMGSAGNAMVGGSGLLGGMADVGYALTGGAATSALSGGTAALLGGGSIAGGVAAMATLVSGGIDLYDAYKAVKAGDMDKTKSYEESAAWKAGGVGAGAIAGAAIGSVVPVIGTAAGALIGAGVGGVAGWIKGGSVKKEYQKQVEEMQKEAENVQKVFQATGLSMEEVTFKSIALSKAVKDNEVSAQQFALMFREECAETAKRAFGDITLSLDEVKKIASEITFADMTEELNGFSMAAANVDAALNNLQVSVADLKKENWKVSIGMELSETDRDSYKSAIENFMNASQTFIGDNHYEATVALKLLVGGDADMTGLDNYYGSLKIRLDDLSTRLTDSMNIALEDGIITLDEAAELENLQNQISEITNKLTDAKTDAQMQALQIKYNGAALDADSFRAMQEELQANVVSASDQYENALTLTLTNLNLQFADGTITQDEYDNAVMEATKGYYAQINDLNARVTGFNLESITAVWDSELAGILPDIKGTTKEKLEQALNDALLAHPDVTAWETADVIKWMGLDKLNLDAVDQATIAEELIQTAFAVPNGTKETILQSYRSQIPTAEEIKEAINWDALTNNDVQEMLQQAGVVMADGGTKQIEMPLNKWAEMFGTDYEQMIDNYAQHIYDALDNNPSNDTLNSFMEQYMSGAGSKADGGIVSQLQEVGTTYGNALNSGVSESILSGSYLIRTDMQTVLDDATTNPFTVSPVVNMMPSYKFDSAIANLSAVSPVTSMMPSYNISDMARNVSGHASGGYVSGGPQLSWLAEEGYGEFVIPTNPSRRSSALDLYEQAGIALGVSAHAAGGYVGGSTYNRSIKNDNAGEPIQTYEATPTDRLENKDSASIQVSVSVSPEFVINGAEGQNEDSIMQILRRHMREIADELGGEIAGKFEEVFSNMPLKEA